MTSSALSVIGWTTPAGRTLSPVARKLTLPKAGHVACPRGKVWGTSGLFLPWVIRVL